MSVCQEARAAATAAPSPLRTSLSSEHLTSSKVRDARKQTAERRHRINLQTLRGPLRPLEVEGPINPSGKHQSRVQALDKSTVRTGFVYSHHYYSQILCSVCETFAGEQTVTAHCYLTD